MLKSSRSGLFYGCTAYPNCDMTHGAHKDGTPLGKPGNKVTRQARMQAHDVFDKLWKKGHMSRGKAYRWMQRALDMSPEEAHIGNFDIETCKRLIEAVQNAGILENRP